MANQSQNGATPADEGPWVAYQRQGIIPAQPQQAESDPWAQFPIVRGVQPQAGRGPWELYQQQAAGGRTDLSSLSDEQLTALYNSQMGAQQNPLAALSDDELKALYAKTRPSFSAPPGMADMDEPAAGEWLKTVPEASRDAATNAWADARVAKEREGGGLGMRVNDAVSRVSRMVPGAGAYTDEADAALSSAMGGDYALRLAYRRAQDRAADAAETPSVTLPGGYKVYESGAEKALGAVAGGLAMPVGRVMAGEGLVPGGVNAAANAGAYGAVDAFGRGEGGAENRLSDAAQAGAESAALGGALGGAVGALARRYSPATAAEAAASPRGQTIQAAEDLRQNVGPQTLPSFVANAGQNPATSFAGAASSFPGATRLRNAASDTIRDLGNNVMEIADQYGRRGTGATVGAADAAAATEAAGQSAGDAIRNWMGPATRLENDQNYGAVRAALPVNAREGLPNTMLALQDAMNRAHEAASPVGDQLFSMIGDAVTRPQGMTFDGLQQLKSEIQSLQSNKLLPDYTKLKDYLKPISSALDADLRNLVQKNGGAQAAQLYNQAVTRAQEIINQRKGLAKIVGDAFADSPNAASPAQVVDRLLGMASNSNRTNDARLTAARNAITASSTPEAWNDIAAAAIRRMGEGPAANPGAPGVLPEFSPDRWLRKWDQLSENGKSALFGPQGSRLRDSLENVNTISEKFRSLRQFQNPSGTGHTFQWFELALLGWEAGPIEPLTQYFGANAIARFLSRPATARAVSQYGQAAYNFMESGGKGSQLVKVATLNLAHEIAKETGEDEDQASQRVFAALPPAVRNQVPR
jgi:hypothetical protein